MGIVYLISLLMLIIAFMLIKKTENKLNILSFTGITLVCMFIFNALICYILTFIRIPITLLTLSITNLTLTIIISILIYKQKEIQKYKIDKIRKFMHTSNTPYNSISINTKLRISI